MRRLSFCLALLFLAPAAFAQLTPGITVPDADCFPFVVDFNGDGLDDLIQNRQVLINTGSSFVAHDLGIPKGEHVIGVLDVNGDGIPDLLTDENQGTVPAPHGIRLYISDTSHHYTNGIVIAENTAPPLIADVDGDGKDDLLLLTRVTKPGNVVAVIGYTLDVLRSRGDGTFDHLQTLRIPGFPQDRDPRVSVGDLDHDGLPDIVLRTPEDLVILHGTGGGKFDVERRFTPPDYKTWGSWDMHLADIDGDGNLDVVMVGVRMIRVLFGDGHGNLPRMATATIAKSHEATDLWWYDRPSPDAQYPRDLAIGHFTSKERTEIAAALFEGDLVVFAYQNGALTEVGRTQTEFYDVDIQAGNFRGQGTTDLFAVGVLQYKLPLPPARIFYGSEGATTVAVSQLPGRHRAARPPAPSSPSDTVMNVFVHSCSEYTQRIAFQRDGVFGHAENAEAVFDGATIYLRMSPPFNDPDYPMTVALTPQPGGFYLGVPAMALLEKCYATNTVTANVE